MDRLAARGRPPSGPSDTADAILDAVREEFGAADVPRRPGAERARRPAAGRPGRRPTYMSVVVVDASVVLRWLLVDEPDREPALAVRDRIQAGRLEPRQPPHVPMEVASALAVTARLGRLEPSMVGPLVRSLEAFRLDRVDPHDFASAAAETALDLGCECRMRTTSCARRTGGTLITADRRLFEVALRSGAAVAFLGELAPAALGG